MSTMALGPSSNATTEKPTALSFRPDVRARVLQTLDEPAETTLYLFQEPPGRGYASVSFFRGKPSVLLFCEERDRPSEKPRWFRDVGKALRTAQEFARRPAATEQEGGAR